MESGRVPSGRPVCDTYTTESTKVKEVNICLSATYLELKDVKCTDHEQSE